MCAIRPQQNSFPAASTSQGSHLLLQPPVPAPGQGTALGTAPAQPRRPATTLCLSFCLKPAAELWETWIFWVLDLIPTTTVVLDRV